MRAEVLAAFLVVAPVLGAGLGGGWLPGDDAGTTVDATVTTDGADWGTFTWNGSGQAGDWVVLYRPLPAPTDDVSYDIRYEVTASGSGEDPTGVFIVPPELFWRESDGTVENVFLDPDVRVAPDGGDIAASADQSWRSRISGAVWDGFLFAVGADADWTAEVTVDLASDGATVGPDHHATGTGTTLAYPGQRLAGLPDGPAGRVDLDRDLARGGWSHLEVQFDPLQPDGVRDYDVRFPDGSSWDKLGYGYGAYAVLVGYSHRSNKVDFLGTMADEPGPFRSRVTYAEATTRLDLALMHLPSDGGHLPADMREMFYVGFDDPFGSGPLMAPGGDVIVDMERIG